MLRFNLTLNKAIYRESIWENYYPFTTNNYNRITDNTKPTIESDFFLLLSDFANFSENVINCSVDNIKLLHSICTYTNITRNEGDGGCIFFKGDSSIIQDRICAIKCYTPNNGKYSYTDVKAETNKNFLNLSSLYQCGHDYQGYASIYHSCGNKILIRTNSTNTKCFQSAGYHFENNPVKILYCCFTSNDNSGLGSVCMNHYETPNSFVSMSIFKNNTCKIDHPKSAIINYEVSDQSNLNISKCIFLENKAKYTFYAHSGRIIVKHCTGILSKGEADGSVNTDEMVTDSFKLTFEFLSLGKCEAEHPFLFKNPLIDDENDAYYRHLVYKRR